MVPVQEGHFAIRFYPYLCDGQPRKRKRVYDSSYFVFCVLGDVVQSCYVQLELPRLAEFSKTCSQRNKVWPCDRDAEAHGLFRDIVHSVFLQPETVCAVRAVDEMNEVFSLKDLRQGVTRGETDERCSSRAFQRRHETLLP